MIAVEESRDGIEVEERAWKLGCGEQKCLLVRKVERAQRGLKSAVICAFGEGFGDRKPDAQRISKCPLEQGPIGCERCRPEPCKANFRGGYCASRWAPTAAALGSGAHHRA